MPEIPLYPILTERRLVNPIWGGQRLAAWLHLPEPYPPRLGETWQVYDTNVIRNGTLAGQTLSAVTQRYGEQLVGSRNIARYGADFPLLAKFIDANDCLSIQVHPDDTYAHSYENSTGFHGKTEAWYILDAAPGADIICGLTHPTCREEFVASVEAKTLEPLLQRIPVRAGDVIFVPAGTLHAINAGIVLFEIQQKSDLTYRVYDYGRRDAATGQLRPLHLEKALDVLNFAPAPRSKLIPLTLEPDVRLLLAACSYFALEHWNVRTGYDLTTDPGSLEIFTVIRGQGQLTWSGGDIALMRGESVVLPATLGNYTLSNSDEQAEWQLLRAYVPDLVKDLFEPLYDMGYDEARVAQTVIL